MFCLVYWLTPKRNRSLYMLALFLMFVSSLISIALAFYALKASFFNQYSRYLKGSVVGMAFICGLVMGIVTICLSLFGCLLISRKYKKHCMHYWFAILGFFTFIILMALGVTILSTGFIAGSAIR